MPDLPPPLPPHQRTVGQLIAETIRFYGHRFWAALPLGAALAVADQFAVHRPVAAQMVVFWAATPLIAGAFVYACVLVHGGKPTVTVFALALLIYLPFPALRAVYLLPAVAWFALVGLAVPAALVERLGWRAALVRGRQLGTADYAHALGSLAALVIVVGLAEQTLTALLRTQGDTSQRIALGLADVVLSPLLYLGGALLYLDQAARVGSRRSKPRRTKQGRRRDADLHPAVDADPTGRSDPQVEP
ncbi:MAG TPA: hypothetical protein VF094_02395 [Gaiellaceae bacterium]